MVILINLPLFTNVEKVMRISFLMVSILTKKIRRYVKCKKNVLTKEWNALTAKKISVKLAQMTIFPPMMNCIVLFSLLSVLNFLSPCLITFACAQSYLLKFNRFFLTNCVLVSLRRPLVDVCVVIKRKAHLKWLWLKLYFLKGQDRRFVGVLIVILTPKQLFYICDQIVNQDITTLITF